MARTATVVINANVSGAISAVERLAGALSRLDAMAKRSVESQFQSLRRTGTQPQNLAGSVQRQQAAANNAANSSSGSGAVPVAAVTAQPNPEIVRKEVDKAKRVPKVPKPRFSQSERLLNKYAGDIGGILANSVESLLEGGLKGALKSLQSGLRSLLNGLMQRAMNQITSQIRDAITKRIKESFTKFGTRTAAPNRTDGGGHYSGNNNGGGTNNGAGNNGGTGLNVGIGNTNGGGGPVRIPTPPPEATPVKDGSGNGGGNNGGSVSSASVGVSIRKDHIPAQFATMLPGLGASFGGMLGLGNGGASMLGSAGGLLAGGIGMAFLAPSALTGIFGGTIAGVGGATASTGLAGAMAGFLTNPFTIAAAGAILIGAYIWGRNARRRKEEKQRNQAMLDSLSQLDELLKQVRRDHIDGGAAVTQANQIRKQYVDQMSQLKDSKTRRIALADVSRIDTKIAAIKQAADSQTARKALDEKLVPTFADGGLVKLKGKNQKVKFAESDFYRWKMLGGDGARMRKFRGRVPGFYDRRDDFLARLSGDEVVLTPDVWKPITPYLKEKQVPGFADGGIVSGQRINGAGHYSEPSNSTQSRAVVIEELVINLSNSFGVETAARVIGVALKLPDGQQAVVKSVRSHIGESGLGDGLVRDINRVNERGF
jgi:hypothetical protein